MIKYVVPVQNFIIYCFLVIGQLTCDLLLEFSFSWKPIKPISWIANGKEPAWTRVLMEGVSGFPVTGSNQRGIVPLSQGHWASAGSLFFPLSFLMYLQPWSCPWIPQEMCELMKPQVGHSTLLCGKRVVEKVTSKRGECLCMK